METGYCWNLNQKVANIKRSIRFVFYTLFVLMSFFYSISGKLLPCGRARNHLEGGASAEIFCRPDGHALIETFSTISCFFNHPHQFVFFFQHSIPQPLFRSFPSVNNGAHAPAANTVLMGPISFSPSDRF